MGQSDRTEAGKPADMQFEVAMMVLHQYLVHSPRQGTILAGSMIASFYISLVVFGNHEREKRYRGGKGGKEGKGGDSTHGGPGAQGGQVDFLEQQLCTTTDYEWNY